MTEPERRRTTVTLSSVNHDWLAERARRQRRAFTQELDLLVDAARQREQSESEAASRGVWRGE